MKVSIVIPIFNQDKYLQSCLESIVNQGYDNFEAILVNDGSTDDSEDICQRYTEKYKYFRYIYQSNAGLGEARNTGLKQAQGKYVLFLDSDDAICVSGIPQLLTFAEKNNADIVYFDELVCDELLSPQYIYRTYSEMDTQIEKIKALELSMHPSHICARMFRRELFNDIRFNDIWYEDMEIFPRLIARAKRLFYYKVPIYYYRQHKNGITHQFNDKRNLDAIIAWKNAYEQAECSEDEKNALEICIKKSIYMFLDFRPEYAINYIDFYNHFFIKRQTIYEEYEMDIEGTALWLQADFYGYKPILDTLKGLKALYQQGGTLNFFQEYATAFSKERNEEEQVLFSFRPHISVRTIQVLKWNPLILKIFHVLSKWNLISLRNQIKEFKISHIIMENTLLCGILIDEYKEN